MFTFKRKHTLAPGTDEYTIATHLQEVGPLTRLEAERDYKMGPERIVAVIDNLCESGYDIVKHNGCWRLQR